MKTENEEEFVSKSQLKRDAEASLALGKRLTRLNPSHLLRLTIDEEILEAVHAFNNLPNSFGAQRRQLQLIGKLIRKHDSNEIEEALEKATSSVVSKVKEKTEDPLKLIAMKILNDGGDEIEKALLEFKDLDRQQLRQLHREYIKGDSKKKSSLVSKCRTLLNQ